ncbi:MAG: ABC transporter permease [Candidatus Eisenbacteria bacterium]
MNEFLSVFSVSLFLATIRKSIPLIFASTGGFFSERAGVINIGLEGMMLFGAFSGAIISVFTHNPWLGVLGAAIVGGLVGYLHAIATITLRANQIISGVAINMLGVGGTIFLCQVCVSGERSFSLGPADRLPVWGSFIPLVYMAFLVVGLAYVFAYFTVPGLRLRAVGEHPRAADTQGIDVNRTRFIAVIISGVCAGLGGAYLPFFSGSFAKNMTSGQGFIALAALIFGKWNPLGAMAASLLFGFADALQETLQGRGGLPPQLFQVIPYVLTIVALAGVIGRSVAPAAVGKHYTREVKD